MKRFISRFAHPPALSFVSRVATLSVVGLLIGVAFFVHGCMNEHYRPRGHIDITFGISPSGDLLVFNAVGEGGRDLYLLHLKTFRVTRIAATPDYEVDPEFSPDGKSVVYAAGKPGDRADHLFLRSLDGKTVKQLTTEDANDASPAFSPDGSLIAFTRDKTYDWGGLAANWGAGVLCVMRADGTGLQQLTKDDSFASDPQFSPDGRTVLFWSVDGPFTVVADGSAPPRPLGAFGGDAGSYSPDGHSLAFSSGQYANDCRIFVAQVDGTGLSKLTPLGEADRASPNGGCFRPAFTPDGKRIIFFVESWPNGPTGDPKESLWETDIKEGKPREIADYSLFDDPLNWKPKPPIPAKRP